MSDFAILAIAVVIATPLALVVSFFLRQVRLNRAVRNGYLQTYGITGRKADLDLQIKDLREKHAAVLTVDSRAQVLPFPGRAERRGRERA